MLSREEKLVIQDVFDPDELVDYLIKGGFIDYDTLIDALEPELEEGYEDIMELAGVRLGREFDERND